MINYIENHTDSQNSFRNIFAFIIKHGKTTRREIQKQTKYSWSSVSSVVSVLLNKGQVIETESIVNGVGRGTSYIIPNGNKYVSLGVDINSSVFSLSVIGIDGSIKFENKYLFNGDTEKEVLNLLFQVIDQGIAFIGDKYTLVSIGISCQGTVDLNHEIFKRFIFTKDMIDCPLKKIIEEKYKVFAYLEHDTNCLLEAYRSTCDNSESSICVARVVSGIGFAICVNGQPLEEFGPIDFGHMIVQPKDGRLCTCGRRGCLEAYSSSCGIIRRAGVSDFSIIKENREKYRNILDEAGFNLGVAFANMSHIFELKDIIITGDVIGNDEKMIQKIIEANEQYCVENKPNIVYIDDLSPSFGAAKLSFKEKINNTGTL